MQSRTSQSLRYSLMLSIYFRQIISFSFCHRNAYPSCALISPLFGLDFFCWADRVWSDFCRRPSGYDFTSKPSFHFLARIHPWSNSFKFITNTFTLTSPALTPLGITVSPPFALINHSCDPNAIIVFPRANCDPSKHEPLMQLIALREIRANEEVWVSNIIRFKSLTPYLPDFDRLYWHNASADETTTISPRDI